MKELGNLVSSILKLRLKMITSIGGQLLLNSPNYMVKRLIQTPVGISVAVRTKKAYNPSFFPSSFFCNHGHGFSPTSCSNDGRSEVYVNPHQVSLYPGLLAFLFLSYCFLDKPSLFQYLCNSKFLRFPVLSFSGVP